MRGHCESVASDLVTKPGMLCCDAQRHFLLLRFNPRKRELSTKRREFIIVVNGDAGNVTARGASF